MPSPAHHPIPPRRKPGFLSVHDNRLWQKPVCEPWDPDTAERHRSSDSGSLLSLSAMADRDFHWYSVLSYPGHRAVLRERRAPPVLHYLSMISSSCLPFLFRFLSIPVFPAKCNLTEIKMGPLPVFDWQWTHSFIYGLNYVNLLIARIVLQSALLSWVIPHALPFASTIPPYPS